MPKITNAIRTHKPAKKGQIVVRDTTPGFFAIIGKTSRTFYYQVEVQVEGKRRVHKNKIGPVEDWDANAARIFALEKIKAIKEGSHVEKAVTLGDAWAHYRKRLVRRIANGLQSERTLEAYDDKMDRLFKDWLDMPLKDLGSKPLRVAQRHDEITEKNGPVMANMALKVLRAVYQHAQNVGLEEGLPARLPTSAVEFNPEGSRDTALDPKDMARWHAQLRRLSSKVRQEHHLFLLLSGSRPGAMRAARWDDLDLANRFLHLPNPKGGPKRAYDIPLSKPMIQCLCRARRASRIAHAEHAKTYIFAGEFGPLSHSKETRKQLSHWGGDLRQTHKTVSTILGIDGVMSSLLLGHSLAGVNNRYLKKSLLGVPLLAAQQKVSTYIVEHFDL